MPVGDDRDPEGMRWTDANGWVPDWSPVPPKSVTRYRLLDQEGEKEIEYLKTMHKHFVQYLAGQYRAGGAVEIARLCDETLDRSGRLLGEVRDVASAP